MDAVNILIGGVLVVVGYMLCYLTSKRQTVKEITLSPVKRYNKFTSPMPEPSRQGLNEKTKLYEAVKPAGKDK